MVVCAGAIQTPALLQRSGLGRRLGATLAAHPTVKLAARFDDELNVPDDVPVHQVSEFAPDLSFGGSASSPGLVALALSDHWSLFGAAVEAWRQIAVYYAAITSEGRGRVFAVPGWRDPVVTYRLTRRDRALLGRGLARLALVLLEAGATAVYPSFRGAPIVRSRRDLAVMQGTFAARRASLMTVHLCSTVPMGGNSRRAADRQSGTRPWHRQRVRQRRVAAARRARREPAGVGDGSRHPQRAEVPRPAGLAPVQLSFRDPPVATLVTGASGWFGRALLAALTDPAGAHQRRSIRALVTSSVAAAELAGLPGVEPVIGDVRTTSGLHALFDRLPRVGPIDVIHAAGVIHPATPSDWVEINARGTANVAATARAAGVRRLVHVSSNSPFGTNPHRTDRFRNEEPYDPYLGYGRSKMLAELRLLDEVGNGLDAVIVRPPWFYGPHQPARQTTFFTLVRKGRFPIVGDGRQRRSMVYVDDLVEGVVRAELVECAAGRGWWIADERPYEINEIVAAVTDAMAAAGLDVAARQLRVPAIVGRAAVAADAAIQRRHRYVAQVHVLGELGATIACDISAAQGELGFQPSVGLVEGMRRSVEWCLSQGIEL